MSSVGLHVGRAKLSPDTIKTHYAITSMMEELEAADWYRQRADDREDDTLRDVLLHNMREEIEHASILIEWLRRNNEHFAKQLKTYLFTEAPILDLEHKSEGKG